jgi:hypothetical protein
METDFRHLTFEQYKRALLALEPELTPRQREILQLHYEAPNHRATAKELAVKLGYKEGDYLRVNSSYGKLGRKIVDMYQLHLPAGWLPLGVLVKFDHPGSEWEWTLWPHLVQALEELGLVTEQGM